MRVRGYEAAWTRKKKKEEGCKLDRWREGRREEVESNEMMKKTKSKKRGRKNRYIRRKEEQSRGRE